LFAGVAGHILPVQSQLNPGDILVIDRDDGTVGRGALFLVDPISGARTLLSDFGDTEQGPIGVNPFGVAVEASGNILVIDYTVRKLFRVDSTTHW